MARGEVTLFDEFLFECGKGTHDLTSDTLKLGIVDNTITPAKDQTSPTWSDFSANEVATTGNYPSGGVTLTGVTFTMVSGKPTLAANDISIGIHASGFTDGYHGILYNSSAAGGEAIGTVDMGGPVSEQADDVDFEWTGGVVFELPSNVLTWE
jgi:hypothetical protein